MKKVFRISQIIILFGIIFLVFSFNVKSQTYQDSCLILAEEKFKSIDANPDSVMIDTCECSDIHWTDCKHLYSKQWYEITFPIGAIHLPAYPPDTTILITWEDVDTNFQDIRNGLYNMQNIFGNYILKKVYPQTSDSTKLGSRFFHVKFNNYIKIDSVVNYLKSISGIESGYRLRIIQYPDDVNDNNDVKFTEIFPNPVSDYIEIKIEDKLSESSKLSESFQIQIFDIYGKRITNLTPTLSKGEGVRIDVSLLPNGIYFLRIGTEVRKFVVMR